MDGTTNGSGAEPAGTTNGTKPAEGGAAIARETSGTEAIELASKTLLGDLRDALLSEIRAMPDAWRKMKEADQRKAALRIEDTCRDLIARGVAILASNNRVAITVNLDQINFKSKGTEAKVAFLGLSREMKHALTDAQGGRVLIVIADAEQHMGARRPAQIDKQEPALPAVAARGHGREDGLAANRAREDLYPDGHANHTDYELGWAEGQRQLVQDAGKAPAQRGRPRKGSESRPTA